MRPVCTVRHDVPALDFSEVIRICAGFPAVFDVRENPVCIQVFSRYIVAVFQHVLQQLFYVWIVGEYIAANFQFFRQCCDLRTAEIEIVAYRKSFRQCCDLRTAEIEDCRLP